MVDSKIYVIGKMYMEYNYEELRSLHPDQVREKVTALFRRHSDEFTRQVLNQKESKEQCRNTKYKVDENSISIGYYEGWDDDLCLVVLFPDRIEYHHSNKFQSNTSIEVLRRFDSTHIGMGGMGVSL